MIKKEFPFFIILLFVIFLSSKALFHRGFFRTIDDVTTVRIIHMAKELQRNEIIDNFPVRIASDLSNNYGYPIYLFYAPLTYYIGALLMIVLKISHITATKWVYVFPLIFGPLLFYWAIRQKLSIFPAIIATCLYTFFPYRGWDTYIRGGVGEAWVMAFIPAMIGGIFSMEKNKNNLGGLIFTSFLFLSVISHHLAGLQAILLVIIYGFIFHLKNKKFWKYFFLGIGLSSFYWLPIIFYLKIVRVTYIDVNAGNIIKHLLPLSDLIKINYQDYDKKFSTIFFYLQLTGIIFFTLKLIFKKNKQINLNKKWIFFWGISGLILYLLLSSSFGLFWSLTLPVSGLLQFPWRLLILLSFIIPFFTGLTINYLNNHLIKLGFSLLIVIISLSFLPIFKPKEYSFFYEYKAEGPCATTTWENEYLPIWVKECPKEKPKQDIEINPKTDFRIIKNSSIDLNVIYKSRKPAELIVYRYYFPGWKIIIDKKNYPIDYQFSKTGIFKTQIPASQNEVRIFYTKTKIMWLADILTIFFLIIFLYNFSINLLKVIRKNNHCNDKKYLREIKNPKTHNKLK